ncbi:PREDICTED: alpha-2-antiplasmin [Nanorana parkeri]|uniref:alpha-2-antiplasmin n=1 Tax=Nanorana parkeri TaxID=125878 RepID=UPI000854F5CF|nr:PREDICTED: alpha-2-antiplasmin [Nanorana parkeri]
MTTLRSDTRPQDAPDPCIGLSCVEGHRQPSGRNQKSCWAGVSLSLAELQGQNAQYMDHLDPSVSNKLDMFVSGHRDPPSEAEVDDEELHETEIGKTLASKTPSIPETTHSNIVDSTSDTWLDLHPGATEFPTTFSTRTTENAEMTSPVDLKYDDSSEDDKVSSSENTCNGDLSREEMRKFADAMMTFSKDLLKQVYLESTSPNVVVSPLSIALGLLHLTLGAEKETEKELLQTLHVESLPCLHEKLQKISKRLVQTALSIAARIYVQKGFQIKKSFLEKSEKLYRSKPVNLGPSMKENVKSINKWVSDATKGKITNFLTSIPEEVVLILLNAIHFKGIWKNKFDPSQTSEDTFFVNDEESKLVDMMHAALYPLSYHMVEKLDSQVARLPFKGNMSFVIVMPYQTEWNVSNILDKLNKSELYSRFHKQKPTTLKVPKLNLNFKLELTRALSNLGLGKLFTDPDLGRISNEDLVVSSVEHQATLDLNEDGVEAAGATAILTSRSLSTFSVNRPFFFFLIDDNTGVVLFCGYVRDPKPDSLKKKREPSLNPEIKFLHKGSIPK